MLTPAAQALDLCGQLSWGRLLKTPLQEGIWSLLEPCGDQNHAPQLCWIRPDLLACVWMAGGGEGTAGMAIQLSLLEAGRGSWTVPQTISRDPVRSEQNPLLFLAGDQLQLIHTAQDVRDPAASEPAGSPFTMQWTARLRQQQLAVAAIAASEPASWAAGAWQPCDDLLPEPAFCRHPPHHLADGRALLPIYRSLEQGGAFGHDHSLVLPLNASGRPSAAAVAVPSCIGRVHGSIVAAADGTTLLQFFRSRRADRIYRSHSRDQGASWSAPAPTELPNNNSSIQALRLSSGRLAMIFNRFALHPEPVSGPWGEAAWPRSRWPLAIALSDDDGDSWPWIRSIDHGDGFCGDANWPLNGALAYPSIVEGLPGELHIAYSWAGRLAIRYLCLQEQEILG